MLRKTLSTIIAFTLLLTMSSCEISSSTEESTKDNYDESEESINIDSYDKESVETSEESYDPYGKPYESYDWLDDVGFQNFNVFGLERWVKIRSFDFSENKITTIGGPYNYELKGNYAEEYSNIYDDDPKIIETTILDNDVLTYYEKRSGKQQTLNIINRHIDAEKGFIVVEAKYKGRTLWLTPLKCIDLSIERTEIYDEEYDSTYYEYQLIPKSITVVEY